MDASGDLLNLIISQDGDKEDNVFFFVPLLSPNYFKLCPVQSWVQETLMRKGKEGTPPLTDRFKTLLPSRIRSETMRGGSLLQLYVRYCHNFAVSALHRWPFGFRHTGLLTLIISIFNFSLSPKHNPFQKKKKKIRQWLHASKSELAATT